MEFESVYGNWMKALVEYSTGEQNKMKNKRKKLLKLVQIKKDVPICSESNSKIKEVNENKDKMLLQIRQLYTMPIEYELLKSG